MTDSHSTMHGFSAVWGTLKTQTLPVHGLGIILLRKGTGKRSVVNAPWQEEIMEN